MGVALAAARQLDEEQVDPAELLRRIQAKEAVVGVVGLGYVGLPLALTYNEAGYTAVGFDVDAKKLDALQRGESYIRHVPASRISEQVRALRLSATGDFSRIAECDAVIVCVPTPLNASREPDMSFIVDTTEAIAPHLRRGQLFVLESTTWPGTTEEVCIPILERASGLKAGRDFFVAFSPEREDPGNPNFDTRTIPKIVGGLDAASRDVACALYGGALQKIVPVSGTREAELAKLLENIFRCVNIALVNELKMLCERMNIDVWEVIEAAKTKPFGFMAFYPGPGLGGHCIPIDPFYLTWKARQFDFSTRFIELAGDINTNMPHHVTQRTLDALNERGRALKGAKVLVLGLAYKKNVDDARESPSFRVIELLRAKGAVVEYHDPFVPRAPAGHGLDLESVALTPERVKASDAVVILTDHDAVDYALVVEHAPLVVDTRNATARVPGERSNVVKA